MRAIVSEMLADANDRSGLLRGGGSAGRDGGFFVASGDESFRLEIEGQLQFQFVANMKDSLDEYDSDFVNRRTKLFFRGRVFGDWSYLINGAFSSSTGDFNLEDASVSRDIGESGLRLRIGQFKSGFLLEERTNAKWQLGVDRSYLNEWFTVDRTQGVALSDENGRWRWWAMVSDGVRVDPLGLNGSGANTDLNPFSTRNDVALTAGAEWLFGEDATWRQFRDLTSDPEAPTAARLGVAGHYQEASHRGLGGERDVFTATADLSMEFGGASAQVWGVWQSIQNVAGDDLNQWGLAAQVAAFVYEDQWEIFGRWERLDFGDALIATGRGEAREFLTIGVTRYLEGHALKWVTQATYAFDGVLSPGRRQLGLLGDAAGDDGQIGIVSQIQILF